MGELCLASSYTFKNFLISWYFFIYSRCRTEKYRSLLLFSTIIKTTLSHARYMNLGIVLSLLNLHIPFCNSSFSTKLHVVLNIYSYLLCLCFKNFLCFFFFFFFFLKKKKKKKKKKS